MTDEERKKLSELRRRAKKFGAVIKSNKGVFLLVDVRTNAVIAHNGASAYLTLAEVEDNIEFWESTVPDVNIDSP